MKQTALRIFWVGLAFLMGCANAPLIPEKAVYTDLVQKNLSETQYYKDLGLGFLSDNNYEKAIEYFRSSLDADVSNTDARYWLAVAYFQKKQSNLALIELEKLNLSSIEYSRLKVASEIYESVQSIDKVIEINQKIYALSHEPFPLWKIYEMYLKKEDFDKAFEILTELAKIDKDMYRVHLAKFSIYRKEFKLEKSLIELQKAEKVKPLDYTVMKEMISVLYDLKNWTDLYYVGLKFNKYYAFDEKISEQLAQASIQVGAFDDAISEYKKQNFLYPNSMDIVIKMTNVLLLKYNFSKPEDLYEKLYDITQSDLSLYYISKIHLSEEDFDSDMSKQENLASWSEFYPLVQIKMSRLEWLNSHHDLAIARLARAHELNPKSAEIYQEYGQLLIQSQRYYEAAGLAEKGIKERLTNEQIRLLAIYSYFQLNDLKKFLRHIDKARKMQMSNVVKVFERCLSVRLTDISCKNSVADYFKKDNLPSQNRVPAESH